MRRESDSNERALAQLRVLTATSEALARGEHQSSSEILETVYQQISKLVDTDNMYIALYDEATDTIRFGMAFVDGKHIDVKIEEGWQPRQAGEVRVEEIIHTKKPIFHVTRAEAEEWSVQSGHKDYFGHLPASWLGVPMMAGKRVLGVIAIYHPTHEYAYNRDDLEILWAMADQAAIALENAALLEEKDQVLRSLREEQRKSIAAARLAAVNAVAAGLAHRMNNVAGTIPVRVAQIKEMLDPSDPEYSRFVHYLDAMTEDVEGILRTTQGIRSSTSVSEALEVVNIDMLVSVAIQRIAAPPDILIYNKCDKDLPRVLAFSGQLVDTLENLIRNGMEAIEDSGSVTITGRTLVADSQEWVAIEIEDTGRGIPTKDLSRLFDLFFSTKPGGMGFALWRAKTLVESLGGRIDVSSEVGKGTTFTILLPAEKDT